MSGSSRDRRGRDLSLCQLPPGARPPALPGATRTPDPVPPGATGTPHPVHLPAPRGTPDSAPPGATGYPQGAIPHSAHLPVPSTGTPDSRRWHRGFLRPSGRVTRLPVVLLEHPSTSTLQDAHYPKPPVPRRCPTQKPLATPTPNQSLRCRPGPWLPFPRCHRDTQRRAPPGARIPPPLPSRPPAPGAPRPLPASRCRPYPGAGAAALRFLLLPRPLRGLRRAPAPPLLSLKHSVTRGAARGR